ncbi:hypothetical protein VKT23_020358 [Stygiomarasmius scandens]|uniref:Uncharacterized protein n=1 Tax=Marasmiellus scandens TaxID=2682957 RepID=A0ABR1ILT7_9AGAR
MQEAPPNPPPTPPPFPIINNSGHRPICHYDILCRSGVAFFGEEVEKCWTRPTPENKSDAHLTSKEDIGDLKVVSIANPDAHVDTMKDEGAPSA